MSRTALLGSSLADRTRLGTVYVCAFIASHAAAHMTVLSYANRKEFQASIKDATRLDPDWAERDPIWEAKLAGAYYLPVGFIVKCPAKNCTFSIVVSPTYRVSSIGDRSCVQTGQNRGQ